MAVMTIPEASAKYGRSQENLRKWCRLGRIKARRYGTMWLLVEASLQEFLKNPPRRGPKKKDLL